MQSSTQVVAPRAFELRSESGLRARVLDVGASLTSLQVPTPSGVREVILGYGADTDYQRDPWFMGSTVGRYANRLAHGRLSLGGSSFQLSTDPDSGHCLHGGPEGFHHQVWTPEETHHPQQLVLRHVSAHGTAGFPGRLDVRVTYTLTDPGALVIDYVAVTDRTTVVSMTNHAYFNLHGNNSAIDGHSLQVWADRYTPVHNDGIPVGVLASVDQTRFDFRAHRQLSADDRYDINFVLRPGDDYVRKVASLHSPVSGIRMDVHTSQPGMQLYTGDELGKPFGPRAGLCLETQNFPDAPNQAMFPDATLNTADTYQQRTVYDFRVEAPA
ncbi:MAG: aldose epimerase family protein [Pseudomonadota bacterium]